MISDDTIVRERSYASRPITRSAYYMSRPLISGQPPAAPTPSAASESPVSRSEPLLHKKVHAKRQQSSQVLMRLKAPSPAVTDMSDRPTTARKLFGIKIGRRK